MEKVSAVLLSLFLAAPAWGQQKVKIGFVDLQRAVSESKRFAKAKEGFRAEVKKIEADLLKEKQELERLRTNVDKKGLLLKEQERRNLEKEYQRRLRNYQRSMRDSQQELSEREREMTSALLRELEEVVAEIGKEEKFTLILTRDQLMYVDQAVDITDKVIELYNKRVGNKVGNAK